MATIAEKRVIRQTLEIPEDAFVVGCVAAVKKGHKRIDYLIREFALPPTLKTEDGSREAAKDAKGKDQCVLPPNVGGAVPCRDSSTGRLGWTVAARSAPPTLEEIGKSSHDQGAEVLPELSCKSCTSMLTPFLLIAGAKTGETSDLISLAESLIPGRYKIVTDCSRDMMPDLYRVMDVFVLTSLFEMMPIALLEALASGLPCLVNRHPVLEWMIGTEQTTDHRPQTSDFEEDVSREGAKDAKEERGGARSQKSEVRNQNPSEIQFPEFASSRLRVNNSSVGGLAIDMAREGALASTLASLTPEWLELHGRQARERALRVFSREVVIGQYVKYYREVLGEEEVSREAAKDAKREDLTTDLH